MKISRTALWFLAPLYLVCILVPSHAYGGDNDSADPKLYFEKDCLGVFAGEEGKESAEDETKVEEIHALVRFKKVVVTEGKERLIQISDCHALKAPDNK